MSPKYEVIPLFKLTSEIPAYLPFGLYVEEEEVMLSLASGQFPLPLLHVETIRSLLDSIVEFYSSYKRSLSRSIRCEMVVKIGIALKVMATE